VIKLRRFIRDRPATGLGETRSAYKILVWKPVETRELLRPRYRFEDNIKVDLEKEFIRLWTEFFCLRENSSGGHL
jgi:hypothetical protein